MRLFRRPASIAALSATLSATLLLLAGCAGAPAAEERTTTTSSSPGYPVEITGCGYTGTVTAPPQRAITLNQGATEVALALGVADQLAGTAYLDDQVAAKWREDYESVPVLSDQYPTKEEFLAADPDFAYASYSSAFAAKTIGTRAELAAMGIPSYLSPFACENAGQAEPSFAAVWSEVAAVAEIFGKSDRAAEIIAEQQEQLDELAAQAAGEGLEVFWYDSGDRIALAGVGDGGPQLVLDAIGATNIFADLEGGWADVSWEKVVAADPDVIVLADASWSSAGEKRKNLETDPVLRQMRAVRENSYLTVPYSESTPGVRLVDGATSLAEQLVALEDR